ncbi:MAG TPA: AIPR family protein [Bacteroidota bacterium]|nr:AIPR family protein [Bacteroidota bacterium]
MDRTRDIEIKSRKGHIKTLKKYYCTINGGNSLLPKIMPNVLNLDYPKLLELFPQYLVPGRNESASFLMWYLENYYRLDQIQATDSVCDKTNDYGIDGIYVNDNDKTITVFQSRISQSPISAIGDKSLREFAGTLTQFSGQDTIQNLLNTANEMVVGLLRRGDVLNKIVSYEIRGEFLSNINTDANGNNFLSISPIITFVGKDVLLRTYISNQRDEPIHKNIGFDISGFNLTEYKVDSDTRAVIAPIRATELVKMDGITDQSLFQFNVRGPLGKTGVNREIKASILQPKLHKLFPLFHNGITVVSGTLETTTDSIMIGDYFVVNGCQSITALFNNRAQLTDDLRILVKIIKLQPTSELAKQVTEYSNTQNGVRDRDFKSNDRIQIRLQNEFEKNYKGEYFFEIKEGETKKDGVLISNEDAGLLLMSFDLKEPWATHRKYQVFEDKHNPIFGRKEVNADRIVFVWEILEAIKRGLPLIENKLVSKYGLTKYALLFVVRNIFETERLSSELLSRPDIFVRHQADRDRFAICLDRIIGDIINDINAELNELSGDFDYRNKLRDEAWIKGLNKEIITTRNKLVRRKTLKTFSDEWEME